MAHIYIGGVTAIEVDWSVGCVSESAYREGKYIIFKLREFSKRALVCSAKERNEKRTFRIIYFHLYLLID